MPQLQHSRRRWCQVLSQVRHAARTGRSPAAPRAPQPAGGYGGQPYQQAPYAQQVQQPAPAPVYGTQPTRQPVPSPAQPQPFVQAPRRATRLASNAALKWAFVGVSVVLMGVVAFVPWIGLPPEYAEVMSFLGVSSNSTSFTLLTAGLGINNDLLPPLRELAEYSAMFGVESEYGSLITLLQVAAIAMIVLWVADLGVLGYAVFADATGRKPAKWAYPVVAVTCLIVLVVIALAVGSLVQQMGGGASDFSEGMGAVMGFLMPGYWITLVGSVAASVSRFVLS